MRKKKAYKVTKFNESFIAKENSPTEGPVKENSLELFDTRQTDPELSV